MLLYGRKKYTNQSINSLSPCTTNPVTNWKKMTLKKKKKVSYFTSKTTKVRILLHTSSAKSSITLWKAETDTLVIVAELHSWLHFISSHRCTKESSHIRGGVHNRKLWHTELIFTCHDLPYSMVSIPGRILVICYRLPFIQLTIAQ